MPHINRIRVNNVKYNFGTQYYDDFIMHFDGKNALYDLANGGGKSVLMLLLFQNLIPNCTLDDKQPVEKLFRTNDGSSSIHSLVEWHLDQNDIVDGYKYMLTGFCARKAKNDDAIHGDLETAAIDYYNYVIFYQKYNDNDIVNLPLKKNNERMTYTGLRAYLRELEHKDYGLKIYLFDRKGEYQRFIANYGLYESQWEIIRGINKTEGHVRTYFENSYKTTRKVVEDLLIEEIIQKAFLNKTEGKDVSIAETLYDIRTKLKELSGKRQEIGFYEQQILALESFETRIKQLAGVYDQKNQFEHKLVQIYQSLLAQKKKQEEQLETYEKAIIEKHQYLEEVSRKLDTVKVQKNMQMLKNMEADHLIIEENLEKLEKRYGRLVLDYDQARALRDYSEYQEYEKNIHILQTTMANAGSDQKEMLIKLQTMASFGKQLAEKEKDFVQKKIVQTQNEIKNLEAQIAETEAIVRQLDLDEAVLTNNMAISNKHENQLIKDLAHHRHQVNALLLEGTKEDLEKYKIKVDNAKAEYEENKKLLENMKAQHQDMMLALEQEKSAQALVEYQKKEVGLFFETYKDQLPKIESLYQIYQVFSPDALKEKLSISYKKNAQNLVQLQTTLNEQIEQKEQYTKLNPMILNKGMKDIMAYIERYHHIQCISGSEYLVQLEENQRDQILENIPYLPYAVILQSDYSKIINDEAFRKRIFANYQIPILYMEDVVLGEKQLNNSRVIFKGIPKELFSDQDALSAMEKQCEKEIETIKKQMEYAKDQEKTYMEDLAYVHYFISHFYHAYTEKLVHKDELESKNQQIKNHLQDLNQKLEALMIQINDLNIKNDELRIVYDQKVKEYEAVEQMTIINGQLDAVRIELLRMQKEHAATINGRQNASVQLDDMKNKNSQWYKILDQQESQYKQISDLWQNLFAPYYLSENTDQACAYESIKVLENDFRGLLEIYQKKYTDTEDKKKLLESYSKAMERLKRNIEERGQSIEQLIQLQNMPGYVDVDENMLVSYKMQIDEIQKEIASNRKLADHSKADTFKLTGSVENAVSVIEERYGSYNEVDLKNMDYEIFIQEYSRSYQIIQEELLKITQDRDLGTKNIFQLEELIKDAKRLLHSAKIDETSSEVVLLFDLDFLNEMTRLQNQYEQLCKEDDRVKAEFIKDKDKLIQSLSKARAHDLADEIRYQIQIPKDEQSSIELQAGLADTIRIIMLEKDRIEKGLTDMQRIKDNFVNQCVQRCIDIKMELDRLPKMSRITLDDEDIQMINLKIPYVREEMYGQRMAAYIDQLVAYIDTIDDETARMKHLRHHLDWKHLFSVIVTDMDQIKMFLYKRERIKEQSRFLRYEEAVGSTGQSQGIYIQFLIAVINYISAIHSRNVNISGLKKVIFIDNPFGAAKDIYIWEPIFALLKENNVQLIVPARGATPAITGMFDVNYILGQKIVNQKQQTVVIDYHSNVKIDEMTYTKIDFEQEVFDFL